MKATWVRISIVFILATAGCGSSSNKGSSDDASRADAFVADGSVEQDSTACVPSCDGTRCGDDGCGNPCGCPSNLACDEPTGLCSQRARLSVPMRDGVRLDTHVLLPSSGEGPWPVLLKRTPYFLSFGEQYVFWPFQAFTEEGYVLVVQACRGTGESEGELRPLGQELEDGHDTVMWAASRSFSSGRVGTFGASYEGFTALAAAIDTEPVKVVIADGAPAHAFAGWPGLRGITTNLLWWIHMVETGEDLGGDLPFLTTMTNHKPVRDLDTAAFDQTYPIWRSALPHMEQADSFWEEMSLDGRLSGLCAPVVHLQARMEWEDDALDIFLEMDQSPCSEEVRSSQRFVLGSHDHGEAVYAPFADSVTGELIRSYLARYLKDEDIDVSSIPRIQFHTRNTNEWREAGSWPLATSIRELYLHPAAGPGQGGELLPAMPTTDGTSTYIFDPEVDDACDGNVYTGYIWFEGVAADTPFDLVGGAELVLFVSVDTQETDLFAYLYEVTQDEEWEIVHYSRLRMRYRDSYYNPAPCVPGEPYEVRVTLPVTAVRVREGERLAVILASSACGFSESTNTFGSIVDQIDTLPATVSILSGPDHPSRLLIPVLE